MRHQPLRDTGAVSPGLTVTHVTEIELRRMVPAEGFEPPTYGLQNRCTTTVLSRQS